jgi:membrane-anchored protein YejM (alkaline phosphatase superfamily)
MIYTESPRRKLINDQVSWGHWFAFANILLAIIISSVYVIASPAPTSFVSSVYLFLTWFGHISFITFFGFIVLLLPLCYQLSNTRVLKIIGSVTAAIALALLAFDALLFNKTGFHITWSSAELLRTETQGQISAFSWLQWFYLVLLFVVWLMFQLVIANAIFRHLKRFQKIKIGKYVTPAFLTCFVTSHAIHVWADAKLYAPVLQQDNMFPLSYPATAKTLMSRAGLLDLQDYRQRQNLQFDDNAFSINYPPEQIYCSVDNTKKAIFLRVKGYDPALKTNLLESGLNNNGFHFISETLHSDYLASVVYGMPQAFLEAINTEMPVSLALPKAFDTNITVYSTNELSQNSSFIEFIVNDESEFLDRLKLSTQGLFIASMSFEQLSKLDLSTLAEQASLLIAVDSDKAFYKELYSNINTSVQMSTTEDIAPTLVTELGCSAQAEQFSMGQALQSPKRNWSISTQGAHLVVVHNGLITEVSRDGSFEIRDYMTNQKVLTEIDTNLLSRSIKHFSTFTEK